MFVRKFSLKITVTIFVVLCVAVSFVVFNSGKDKKPVESAKTEHQLREQVIDDHLESKGRPRVERGNTESLTADLQVFVLDPNTPPPSDMPKDAIIVTSPEDINSAVTNYINRQKPEKTVTMANIADILESRKLGPFTNL